MRRRIAAAIAAWLALAGGVTLPGSGARPSALLLAVPATAALAAFAALWGRSRPFRVWAVGLNLRALTWLQVWRVALGAGLLVLYHEGRLPWRLGLAHGLAALALGVSAPVAVRWTGAATIGPLAALFAWHAAGVLSLVALAIRASRLALQGDERVAVLATFPWSLLPTFVGPAAILAQALALAIIWARPLTPGPRP
jgi:hypothetical protein